MKNGTKIGAYLLTRCTLESLLYFDIIVPLYGYLASEKKALLMYWADSPERQTKLTAVVGTLGCNTTRWKRFKGLPHQAIIISCASSRRTMEWRQGMV